MAHISKKHIFISIIIVLEILVKAVNAFGQDPFVHFNVIPTSPHAAALSRFVDAPVSYFTGTPQIGIPLYQIAGKEIAVPISLDYNASGVRVQDLATYVGLGWSLNAGGMVTRSVRGKKDDGSYESLVLPLISDGALDPNQTNEYSLSNTLAEGNIDSEPDHYSFNFCRYSGKFYIVNNQAYLMPQKDILVEKTSGSSSNLTWKITTGDGAQYFFEEQEMTYSHVDGQLQFSQNGWYLTRVISGNYLDTVSFAYSTYAILQPTTDTETRKYDDHAMGSLSVVSEHSGASNAHIKSKVIASIRYKDITVNFLPGAERLDVSPSSIFTEAPEKTLGSMEVTNGNGTLLRKAEFQYSYFGNVSGVYHEKRLRLDKVKLDENEPYAFSYSNSSDVPSLTSMGIDHWGFYNGTNPNTLLPAVEGLPGANREASATHALYGMIDRVTYPTGGYTDYDFQTHQGTSYENVYSTISKASLNGQYPEQQVLQSPNFELIANTENGTASTQVVIDLFLPPDSPVNGLVNATVEIFRSGETMPVQKYTGTVSGLFNLYLTPGTYYVKLRTTAIDSYGSVDISQKIFSGTQPIMRSIGGARVTRITNYDPATGQSSVRKFRYELDETSGASSGVLFDNPNYTYRRGEYLPAPVGPNPVNCSYEFYTYLYHTSINNVPLGAGPHMGYTKVYVYEGETGANGKTVYEYDPVDASTRFYGPIYGVGRDVSWTQGLLEKETTYNAAGQMLRMKDNHYTFVPSANIIFHAVKVQFNNVHPCSSGESPTAGIFKRIFDYAWYQNLSQWHYLDKETIVEYINNQETLRQETVYSYDNVLHKQLSKITRTNSRGEQDVQAITYPQDYPSSPSMQQMAARHILNKAVEKKQLISGKITHATLVNYALFHNKYWLPSKVYQLKAEQPVTDFTVADPNVPPASYLQKQTLGYHDSGLLHTHADASGIQHIYLWDRMNPVCEVTGAEANQVAFTSFEPGAFGNWTYSNSAPASISKTGKRSYAASSAIQCAGLPAGKYEVRAFVRKANSSGSNGTVNVNGISHPVESSEWTELRWQTDLAAAGPVTVTPSANVLLDDLRLYPVDAIMNTYDSESGLGLTSATDSNNRSTYYEYQLGKLSVVRDNDRNITNQYLYHYKGN